MDLIDQAITVLKQGGLVGLPTETVYGLAADATNPDAVNKVFAAKGRPADHPLIVHIGSLAELNNWATDIPDAAYRLAQQYWPGPLTLVLKKQDTVLPEITGGQDTVALRMPQHPLALSVLKAFGRGVVAPSANQFGRISPTDAAAVLAELEQSVDIILAGGRSEIGIESTILDLHQQPFTILRQGMLNQAELEAFLQVPLALPHSNITVRAPGLLASHYAPHTPVQLITVAALADFDMTNRKVTVLGITAQQRPSAYSWQTMPQTPKAYAHELYAALRHADNQNADLILIEIPPSQSRWTAIFDRLQRAAA